MDSSITDSSLDLRALSYVANVDDNLCCPICHSPLIDPTTTKCRHTFCLDCITGALEISSTCPVDRRPLENKDVFAAPIMIANLVNDLVVLCPNSPRGCTATQPRSSLRRHLKDSCGYVVVDCIRCEEKILKKDLRKDCMHKELECRHCSAIIRQLEIEDHELRCPKLSSTCEYCSAEFPRPEINNHVLVCDEAFVTCSACGVGCPWSGRRKQLSDHAIACPFTYLRPLLEDYSARIVVLESENELLRNKMDLITARISSDRTKCHEDTLDLQTIQLLTEQEHVRADLERLFAALADIEIKQSMFTMHMSDNMRTREEIAIIGVTVSNLRTQLHGLQLIISRIQSSSGGPSTTSSGTPSRSAVSGLLPRRFSVANLNSDRVKL